MSQAQKHLQFLLDDNVSLKERLTFLSRFAKQYYEVSSGKKKHEISTQEFEQLVQILKNSNDVQQVYFALVAAISARDQKHVLQVLEKSNFAELTANTKLFAVKAAAMVNFPEETLLRIALANDYDYINQVPKFRAFFLKQLAVNAKLNDAIKSNKKKFFTKLVTQIAQVHDPKVAFPLLAECDLSNSETTQALLKALQVHKLEDLDGVTPILRKYPNVLLDLLELELKEKKGAENAYHDIYDKYKVLIFKFVKCSDTSASKRVLTLLSQYPYNAKAVSDIVTSNYIQLSQRHPEETLKYLTSSINGGRLQQYSRYGSYDVQFQLLNRKIPLDVSSKLFVELYSHSKENPTYLWVNLSGSDLNSSRSVKYENAFWKKAAQVVDKKVLAEKALDFLRTRSYFINSISLSRDVMAEVAPKLMQEVEKQKGKMEPVEKAPYLALFDYETAKEELHKLSFQPKAEVRAAVLPYCVRMAVQNNKNIKEEVEYVSGRIKNEQSMVRNQIISNIANYDVIVRQYPETLSALILPIFTLFDKESSAAKINALSLAKQFLLSELNKRSVTDYDKDALFQLCIEIIKKSYEGSQPVGFDRAASIRGRGRGGRRRRGGRRTRRATPILSSNKAQKNLLKKSLGDKLVAAIKPELMSLVERCIFDPVIEIIAMVRNPEKNKDIIDICNEVVSEKFIKSEKFMPEEHADTLKQFAEILLRDEKTRGEVVKKLMKIDASFITMPLVEKTIFVQQTNLFNALITGKRITPEVLQQATGSGELPLFLSGESLYLNPQILRAVANKAFSEQQRQKLLSYLIAYIKEEENMGPQASIKRKYIQVAATLQTKKVFDEEFSSLLSELQAQEEQTLRFPALACVAYTGFPESQFKSLLNKYKPDVSKAVTGGLNRIISLTTADFVINSLLQEIDDPEFAKKGVSAQKEIIRMLRQVNNKNAMAVCAKLLELWNGEKTHRDVKAVTAYVALNLLKRFDQEESLWKILEEASKAEYIETPKSLFFDPPNKYSKQAQDRVAKIQLNCINHPDETVRNLAWTKLWYKTSILPDLVKTVADILLNFETRPSQTIVSVINRSLVKFVQHDSSMADIFLGPLRDVATNPKYKEIDEKHNAVAGLPDLPVWQGISGLVSSLLQADSQFTLQAKQNLYPQLADIVVQYDETLIDQAINLLGRTISWKSKEGIKAGLKQIHEFIEKKLASQAKAVRDQIFANSTNLFEALQRGRGDSEAITTVLEACDELLDSEGLESSFAGLISGYFCRNAYTTGYSSQYRALLVKLRKSKNLSVRRVAVANLCPASQ